MRRAVLYMRVSSVDQHPETQLHDLRQMATQRGYEIVQEYTDKISGTKARRPGLGDLMRNARRGQSLRQIARYHRCSTATVRRVLASQPPEEKVA